MKKSWLHIFMTILLGCWTIISCSNTDDVSIPQESEQVIKLSEQQVNVLHEGRYYRIVGASDSLNRIRAFTDDNWLNLDADTLSASGSLTFYV